MRRSLLLSLTISMAAPPMAAQVGESPRAPTAPVPAPPSPWRTPVAGADSIMPLLLQGFSLRRVRIGVVVATRPSATDSIGAFLDAVTPGGPAAKAGLRAGDIIVRMGTTPLVARPEAVPAGEKLPSPGFRLVELVAQLRPSDTVQVEYRRGKARLQTKVVTPAEPDNLTVVVGEGGRYGFRTLPGGEEVWISGSDEAEARAYDLAMRRSAEARRAWPGAGMPLPMRWRGSMLDLELAPVNPQLGSYFGTTEGVLVVEGPDSAPLGLKAGDVILGVDGRKVTSPSQFLRILGSYADDEPLKLEVMRQKKRVSLQGTLGQ